jgi:sugar lactone lactonase YvrE
MFSQSGEPLRMWTNVTRPNDLFVNPDGTVIIGELAWEKGATSLAGRVWPEKRDARLTIRDGDGNVLAAWGEEDPCSPGGFSAPHGLWVDSKGSIYVAEVTHTALTRYDRWHESCHSIVKYARV